MAGITMAIARKVVKAELKTWLGDKGLNLGHVRREDITKLAKEYKQHMEGNTNAPSD